MDQIWAMLLSICVEMPVAFGAMLALTQSADLRALRRLRELVAHPTVRMAAVGAAAAGLGTMITHPIVWYGALSLYPNFGYYATVTAVESFAVLGEWPVYMLLVGLAWQRALLVSFIANAVSFGLGLLLF